MVFRRRKQREPAFINIVNVIDVLMMLLIFFMLTTSFRTTLSGGTTQAGISVNLPKATTATTNVVRDMIVITAEKKMYVNDQQIRDLEGLRALLVKLREIKGENVIIVKADETVAHGLVVSVMDVAKATGFSRIAIATKQ